MILKDDFIGVGKVENNKTRYTPSRIHLMVIVDIVDPFA